MNQKKVYLVGGGGYLGTGLNQALSRDPRLNVEVIEANVYTPGASGQDVRQLTPGTLEPGIVVWLATLHKEPRGLVGDDRQRWRAVGTEIMATLPYLWLIAGHKLVYVSSMQVIRDPGSLYGQMKADAESRLVGRPGATVVRFGTIWGNLEHEPARPQTAINAAILDHRLPDDQYAAYTTSYNEAIYQLTWEVTQGLFWGEVRNFCDTAEPVEGDFVRASFDTENPRHRLQATWAAMRATLPPERKESLKSRTHPTKLLASFYNLPYPEEDANV
jgi:hypothetical protein